MLTCCVKKSFFFFFHWPALRRVCDKQKKNRFTADGRHNVDRVRASDAKSSVSILAVCAIFPHCSSQSNLRLISIPSTIRKLLKCMGMKRNIYRSGLCWKKFATMWRAAAMIPLCFYLWFLRRFDHHYRQHHKTWAHFPFIEPILFFPLLVHSGVTI